MKEIVLNAGKTLSSGAGMTTFEKLEIPVTIGQNSAKPSAVQ